jgi:hypothetical protein
MVSALVPGGIDLSSRVYFEDSGKLILGNIDIFLFINDSLRSIKEPSLTKFV